METDNIWLPGSERVEEHSITPGISLTKIHAGTNHEERTDTSNGNIIQSNKCLLLDKNIKGFSEMVQWV